MLGVHPFHPVAGDEGVDLGRREVGVTEHSLQRSEICAVAEQVGREAVA